MDHLGHILSHWECCGVCLGVVFIALLLLWANHKKIKNDEYCIDPTNNHLTSIQIEECEFDCPLYYRCVNGLEKRVCTLYKLIDGHIIQLSEMFMTENDECAVEAIIKAYHKGEIQWVPEAMTLK